MILHHPLTITPRLLAGVRVGDAFISIEPTGRRDSAGRTIWRYIDRGSEEHTGEDLRTHGGRQEALESLLTFLSAAAESYAYTLRTSRRSDNENLFPAMVTEWAHQYSNEISMLAYDLEELGKLIEEE